MCRRGSSGAGPAAAGLPGCACASGPWRTCSWRLGVGRGQQRSAACERSCCCAQTRGRPDSGRGWCYWRCNGAHVGQLCRTTCWPGAARRQRSRSGRANSRTARGCSGCGGLAAGARLKACGKGAAGRLCEDGVQRTRQISFAARHMWLAVCMIFERQQCVRFLDGDLICVCSCLIGLCCVCMCIPSLRLSWSSWASVISFRNVPGSACGTGLCCVK